jgi:hypothetical protein
MVKTSKDPPSPKKLTKVASNGSFKLKKVTSQQSVVSTRSKNKLEKQKSTTSLKKQNSKKVVKNEVVKVSLFQD